MIINITSERLKQETYSLFGILVFMSSWNSLLSWIVLEKSFISLGPGYQHTTTRGDAHKLKARVNLESGSGPFFIWESNTR